MPDRGTSDGVAGAVDGGSEEFPPPPPPAFAPGLPEEQAAKRLRRRPRGFAEGRSVPGMSREEQGGRPQAFRFVQMADTQIGMEDSFRGERNTDQESNWATEVRLARRAVEEVNRLRPAFAIICGDLVDEFPVEEHGRTQANADPRRRELQTQAFEDAIREVHEDIPLFCLCGNHDIGNRPNSATIRRFTDSFGDDYFSFWCKGVKCLVVNSQLWQDDTDAQEERHAMDEWLDRELAETRPQNGERAPNVLIFSHIAPFIFKPDEPNGYFNLKNGLRQSLLQKCAAHGAVGWFCGHYHRNAGGKYRYSDGDELEVVITAAVGVQITDSEAGDPLSISGIGGSSIGEEHSGLRIVDVSEEGRLDHRWWTFAELASGAEAAAASRSSE